MTINPADVIHSDHNVQVKWLADSLKDKTLTYGRYHYAQFSSLWFISTNISYPKLYLVAYGPSEDHFRVISGDGLVSANKYYIVDNNIINDATFGDEFYNRRFNELDVKFKRRILESYIEVVVLRSEDVVNHQFENMIQDFN